MERRYLAAVLGMAAAFAVVSQGLQSGLVERFLLQKPNLVSELKCVTQAVGAKLLAKISPSLHPEDLDAVRLLAKLNIFGSDARPSANPQAKAEPVQVQVQMAAAQVNCPDVLKAQEKALRSAERMQRSMEHVQAKLEKAQNKLGMSAPLPIEAVAFAIPSADEINRQVEISVRAAQNRVTESLRAQISAQALADAQADLADMTVQELKFETPSTAPLVRSISRTQTMWVERHIDRTAQQKKIIPPTVHSTPTHL